MSTLRERAKAFLGPGVDEHSTLTNALVGFAPGEIRAEREAAAALLRRFGGDWMLVAQRSTNDEEIDVCSRLSKSLSEAAGLIEDGAHRHPDPLETKL